MTLTNDNYFSKEASLAYMGSTQYKDFKKCPAMAMAIINGEWERPMTDALLVGSYVDAWFEGSLDKFKEEHPDIYTKKGTLCAPIQKAEDVIRRVQKDALFMRYMGGEKQVILTGTISGVPIKIKIDSYHKGKAIVDLKVLKDMEASYDEETGDMTDFIRTWGYDKQGAMYQAVEGHGLPFYLAVATKEDGIDIELIRIPQTWIDAARAEIESDIGIFDAMKRGDIEAPRCGRCAYCRSTKKITRVISADELFQKMN